MSLKDKEEERDSDLDNSESSNIAKEDSDKVEPTKQQPLNVHSETKFLKPGLEAADIVQDALQLDVDDELNEDRDVRNSFANEAYTNQSYFHKQNETLDSQENMNNSVNSGKNIILY